jgi:hypothetical protein
LKETIMNKIYQNAIVAYDADGKEKTVIELTEKDFADLERAMQWPEDLAAYDRLNTPIKATLEGWIIN